LNWLAEQGGLLAVNLGAGQRLHSVLEMVKRAFEQRQRPARSPCRSRGDRRPGDIAAILGRSDPGQTACSAGRSEAATSKRMCADTWRWQQQCEKRQAGS
jgi:UDP-glucose 4-epimerase